jgi:hypothetical protein
MWPPWGNTASWTTSGRRRTISDIDVALGYNISPHFAGEFNYSTGSFRIHDTGQRQAGGVTLDAMFKFLPGSIVDPYFLIGGGELNDKVGAACRRITPGPPKAAWVR